MPIANGYCSLAELKARLTIETADTQDDAILEACIEGASRQIDRFTGTRFYVVSETRTFTAMDPLRLAIDDATAVSAVVQDLNLDRTFSDVLTQATTWELLPSNAALVGVPYQQIAILPQAPKTFVTYPRSVRVTGSFGYSSTTPPAVKQAALLLSAALFRRKDAPFGVAGGGEVGQAIQLQAIDPQARVLLSPFRRLAVVDLV